jgi:uncharacterized peroxidase-related enzyme
MAWIRTVSEKEATGDLARQYEAALKRAGKVFGIVKLQSLRPDLLRSFMELYIRIMHAPSGLSRGEREMVATIVSRVNHCHY